jgi:hypothetical protein
MFVGIPRTTAREGRGGSGRLESRALLGHHDAELAGPIVRHDQRDPSPISLVYLEALASPGTSNFRAGEGSGIFPESPQLRCGISIGLLPLLRDDRLPAMVPLLRLGIPIFNDLPARCPGGGEMIPNESSG